jgi:hypothetical protein
MHISQAALRMMSNLSVTLTYCEFAKVVCAIAAPRKILMFRSSSILETTVHVRGAIVLWIAFVTCGCQLQEQPQSVRVPAVVTRFTNDPLAAAPGCPPIMPAIAGLPNLKVGLAMQSFRDPVHMPFASQLGTILIRELQLSKGSMQVQPVTLNPQIDVSDTSGGIPASTSAGVISVSFQEGMDVLPPDLPPVPPGVVSGRSPVDQILVVRVIEYRPYYPMRATLEIKVLNGETEEPIYATTASWNAAEYGLVEPRPARKKRHRWFGEAQPTDPSPGHNSPDALMHEISTDITVWYTNALNPPPPVAKKRFFGSKQKS